MIILKYIFRQKKEINDFGEMNEEILLQNYKEKLNITGIIIYTVIYIYILINSIKLLVKSSPSKDARSTSYISIKNGHAMKRNEQGIIFIYLF